jgi:hypothetical protein
MIFPDTTVNHMRASDFLNHMRAFDFGFASYVAIATATARSTSRTVVFSSAHIFLRSWLVSPLVKRFFAFWNAS